VHTNLPHTITAVVGQVSMNVSGTNTDHILIMHHIRSLKKPSEDQSSVEYRKILDMIIMDSLQVLDEPEWPAAEAIARVFSTILVCILLNR